MDILIITGKIIASMFLFALLVTGVLKANPRFHSPSYRPITEYTTGFILSFLACVGFYYLWWSNR